MNSAFLPFPVIPNLFRDPSCLTAQGVRAEKWAQKQVQGDEYVGGVE